MSMKLTYDRVTKIVTNQLGAIICECVPQIEHIDRTSYADNFEERIQEMVEAWNEKHAETWSNRNPGKEMTLEDLKAMEPGKIIASGTGTIPGLHKEPVKWIAKRGGGFHDWAIYYHFANRSDEFVMSQGEKVCTESIIRSLLSCNDEAFKLYRH